MREVRRVLKPNGLAIIEVPFALNAYDTYVKQEVYEREFTGDPVFYQRHYDEHALESRLIKPSRLTLFSKTILGERLPFEKF